MTLQEPSDAWENKWGLIGGTIWSNSIGREQGKTASSSSSSSVWKIIFEPHFSISGWMWRILLKTPDVTLDILTKINTKRQKQLEKWIVTFRTNNLNDTKLPAELFSVLSFFFLVSPWETTSPFCHKRDLNNRHAPCERSYAVRRQMYNLLPTH